MGRQHHILQGWVTDVSETIARIIKKQLEQVHINFNYKVMSSQEYAREFQLYRVNQKSVPPGVEFIVNMVGNPTGHVGFHILCLLHSDGIQSLTHDPKLDELSDEFIRAPTANIEQEKLRELNNYVFNKTRIVPTYQVKEILVVRKNIILDEFSQDGNFIGRFITRIHKQGELQ